MKKKIVLKDDTSVLIRWIKPDDLDRILAFFKELPARDRRYLRKDVTNRRIVANSLQEAQEKHIHRLVAVDGDRIVANATLEIEKRTWKAHIGEIRLMVAQDYRQKGLGMHLAKELYFVASKNKLEEIMVRVMRPQEAAYKIFKRLGFKDEAKLPHYVKDTTGHKQDLIILRCNLKKLWEELEEYFEETDWERRK